MTSPASYPDAPDGAAMLTVRRLYSRYLTDAGITFAELLIVAELGDGGEHEVTDVAARLNFDAPLMSASVANLERARFLDRLYPSASRLSSIRLVSDTRSIAERLLVIQANVDLDLCIVSDQVNHLRRSLLLLARRVGKRAAER